MEESKEGQYGHSDLVEKIEWPTLQESINHIDIKVEIPDNIP